MGNDRRTVTETYPYEGGPVTLLRQNIVTGDQVIIAHGVVCSPMIGSCKGKRSDAGGGAWGETRTLTWLPIPDFESGASTDFATQAEASRILPSLPGSA